MYDSFDYYDDSASSFLSGFQSGSRIGMVISILEIVFMAMTFAKLGQAWWKAIIPVYNVYAMGVAGDRKKAGKNYVWATIIAFLSVILLFVVGGVAFLSLFTSDSSAVAGGGGILTLVLALVLVVALIAAVVFEIKVFNGVSHKFNHSGWFTVLLVLIPVIGFGILALSKKEQPNK
jgi:uncharacterized membrane protein YhaH (DUF805 family)